MKRILLIACFAVGCICAQAQTRGTSAIGLGINISTEKSEFDVNGTPTKSELDDVELSLGYGYFLKDNSKLGFEVSYGSLEGDNTISSKSYGGLVYYQQYYQLVKTLYAFGGGRIGYDYSETKIPPASPNINSYAMGAYGGVSWFLSKRIALEAELLAADIRYRETKSETLKNTSTNFSLNTTGFISGLDFKIFFLF